jgi:cysteine desulfuration protein SufE
MLPARLQERLDDLAMFPDRAERIDALISIAHRYQNVDDSVVPRDEAHRVQGCESEVFIASRRREDGTLDFLFAVDNPQGVSAMALAELLGEALNGVPLVEVLTVPEDVVYDIFGRELSMGKSLGLTGIIRAIKQEAARQSS